MASVSACTSRAIVATMSVLKVLVKSTATPSLSAVGGKLGVTIGVTTVGLDREGNECESPQV